MENETYEKVVLAYNRALDRLNKLDNPTKPEHLAALGEVERLSKILNTFDQTSNNFCMESFKLEAEENRLKFEEKKHSDELEMRKTDQKSEEARKKSEKTTKVLTAIGNIAKIAVPGTLAVLGYTYEFKEHGVKTSQVLKDCLPKFPKV